jgi:hypothetical protein
VELGIFLSRQLASCEHDHRYCRPQS